MGLKSLYYLFIPVIYSNSTSLTIIKTIFIYSIFTNLTFYSIIYCISLSTFTLLSHLSDYNLQVHDLANEYLLALKLLHEILSSLEILSFLEILSITKVHPCYSDILISTVLVLYNS